MRSCRREKRWTPGSGLSRRTRKPAWHIAPRLLPAEGRCEAGDRGDAQDHVRLRGQWRAGRARGSGEAQGNRRARSFAAIRFPDLRQPGRKRWRREGRNSPDDDVEAMKRVTPEDVNRVAKKYLVDQESIAAELKPQPTGAPVAAHGFGGGEELTAAPTKAVELPSWAASKLLTLEKPRPEPPVSDVTLPNGLRLIVRTENDYADDHGARDTCGTIRTWRLRPERKASATCWTSCFPTARRRWTGWRFRRRSMISRRMNRRAFEFSLQVLKPDFARGVQLLADNELNPALPEEAFKVIKPQTAQYCGG